MKVGHHYNQATFDRYAPYIARALESFPGPLRIDIAPGESVETFAGRFRDARKAKTLYGYSHPDIDEAAFLRNAYQLQVAMREGYVLIGTREAIKAVGPLSFTETLERPDGTIEVSITDIAVAVNLCQLIAAKAFKQPVAFTVGPLSEHQVKMLEESYDVAFAPVPDRPDIYTIV